MLLKTTPPACVARSCLEITDKISYELDFESAFESSPLFVTLF